MSPLHIKGAVAQDSPSCGKTTPFKVGSGISKNLLTPCRRVGLCKSVSKRTPSITNTALSNLSSSTSIRKGIKKDVRYSRVSRAKKTLNLSQESSKSPLKSPSILGNMCEPCVLINAVACDKSAEFVNRKEVIVLKDEKHYETRSAIETKRDRIQVNNQTSDLCNSPTILDENAKHNSSKKSNQKRQFARCLSMRKTSSSSIEISDSEDVPSQSKPTFISNEVDDSCSINSDENVTPMKLSKRKIIYSSDEDDFVPSQNSFNKLETVSEIKRHIREKTEHLNKLKQAAIYQKLHKVEEIKELTEIWRMGSHAALRYLLSKLQNHGPMEMPLLLKNLHIPQHLIDYDVNKDVFI